MLTLLANKPAQWQGVNGWLHHKTGPHQAKERSWTQQNQKFFTGVSAFFTGCLTYVVDTFPWDDEHLQHACFIDFEKRKTCSFLSVEYFLRWFSQHLPSEHADEVYNEFHLYQSLPAIPPEIDTSQLYEDEQHTHIWADLLWHRLEHLTDIKGKLKFGLLVNVATLVLILPQSSADKVTWCEKIKKTLLFVLTYHFIPRCLAFFTAKSVASVTWNIMSIIHPLMFCRMLSMQLANTIKNTQNHR